MRDFLVIVHASAGIIGLAVGWRTIAPPAAGDPRRWWRELYLAVVGVLVASLAVIIALDWPALEVGARVAFVGLWLLGAVMIFRLLRARSEAATGRPGWRDRHVDHVYFTYISLWVGVAIIPALRSPRPQLWIPVAVAAVLATGHLCLSRYRKATAAAAACRIPNDVGPADVTAGGPGTR